MARGPPVALQRLRVIGNNSAVSWPRLQSNSLLVVNNCPVEFLLSSLDVLLDGEGFAVFGQRDCARAG